MNLTGKFAPVAPLPIYEQLLEAGVLGGYHLLIATEVAKDPETWREFWLTASDPEPVFIILDNGLIETGASADFGLIRDACDAVEPSCVVLPDVLGNFNSTLKASSQALAKFRTLDIPLMGVVQGTTVEEVAALIKFYLAADVDFISIPRVMVEHFGTRRWLVERARWTGTPIHLLGWSENIKDDLQCTAMEGVMGIDSAVPIWAVLPDGPPPTNADFGKRPATYWESDVDGKGLDLILTNIRWTRKWIEQYAKDARTAEKA